jgi:transposase-like protein
MVKRKHQRHTRAFKEQAIALAKGSDKTLPAVAASLGVPTGTLAYWIEHPPRDRAAKAVAGAAARVTTPRPVTPWRSSCGWPRLASRSASWRWRRRF